MPEPAHMPAPKFREEFQGRTHELTPLCTRLVLISWGNYQIVKERSKPSGDFALCRLATPRFGPQLGPNLRLGFGSISAVHSSSRSCRNTFPRIFKPQSAKQIKLCLAVRALISRELSIRLLASQSSLKSQEIAEIFAPGRTGANDTVGLDSIATLVRDLVIATASVLSPLRSISATRGPLFPAAAQ